MLTKLMNNATPGGPANLRRSSKNILNVSVPTGCGVSRLTQRGLSKQPQHAKLRGSCYKPAVIRRLCSHCLSHLVRGRGAVTQRRPSAGHRGRPGAAGPERHRLWSRVPSIDFGVAASLDPPPCPRTRGSGGPPRRVPVDEPGPALGPRARRTGTRPAPPPGGREGSRGRGQGGREEGPLPANPPPSCLPGLGVGTPGARSHGRVRAGRGGAAGTSPWRAGKWARLCGRREGGPPAPHRPSGRLRQVTPGR